MGKKAVLGIMSTLLLLSMLTLAFNVQPVKAEPKTIWVPDDYPTIQEAVDAAGAGDTIRVRAETYPENILIEGKTDISLIGDGASTTTIKGIAPPSDG